MQISTASLLTAQQARAQTPVQPRAAQTKPAESESFEELLFAKAPVAPAAPGLTSTQPKPTAPFARPGSQIDIKI